MTTAHSAAPRTLQGTTVLVTGGAGFIGSHVVDQLVRAQVRRVVVVDNLSLGKLQNLEQARAAGGDVVVFVPGDCTDPGLLPAVRAAYGAFDWLVHCAVEPLEQSLEDPRGSFHRNVKMVENVCELQRAGGAKALLSFSSSEVYGTVIFDPMTEDHPLKPCTPYAAAKAAGDLLVSSYVSTFGVPSVQLRPFNNYGPRQNLGKYAGVVPVTMRRLHEGQRPIICGSGEQTRDFIYVDDTARGALELMRRSPLDGRVYNLASGAEQRIGDVVRALCAAVDYQGEIQRDPARAGDVLRHKGSVQRFLDDIAPGFAFTDLKAGLHQTVQWYWQSFAEATPTGVV